MIYTGGRNNGASSGLLKSVDGGDHWVIKSNGIFDTRIVSLGIVDNDKGDHVYAGVPGIVYETTDGAETWKVATTELGTCYTFKNGTINGEPYILASCDKVYIYKTSQNISKHLENISKNISKLSQGIANIPAKGGEWNIIPPGGWARAGYLTVADADADGKLLSNSVLGGCLGGHVFVGTIINETAADWTTVNDPKRPCVMLALNPN
eukprot:SAG31_NODE_10621_length_1116_cov_1.349066_2_plen_208_part_00